MCGLSPERGGIPVGGRLAAPARVLLAGAEEGARVPVQHLLLVIHCGAGEHMCVWGGAPQGPQPQGPQPWPSTHLVSEPGPSASEPLRPPSSSRAPPRRLSVVNMPLTSRYTHMAITLDCCGGRGLSGPGGVRTAVGDKRSGGEGAYMVQRRLVQRQAVVAAPIGVALEQEHGDVALGAHDDHVGISHGALYDGGTQVHRDEVQLVHCRHRPVSTPCPCPCPCPPAHPPAHLPTRPPAHPPGPPPSRRRMPSGDTCTM